MILSRGSGILMPLFSLPSAHGIGTLGRAAYEFVDFLAAAGQRYWQLLPLGPTGYGDCPYSSFSSFAGNPYFIDLDTLVQDGLLTRDEVESVDWGSDAERVDYGKLYENRFTILALAAGRGMARDTEAFEAFRQKHARWLDDYALYMALKRRYDMRPWTQWPDEDVRLRRPEALAARREALRYDIAFYAYIQFLFFGQWQRLRAYAAEKGVKIIGDLPIYVAMDSADVWAEPEWFQLDEKNAPVEVSGVPPDAFTADGQLWGNPLYRWDAMASDGYGWWIRRVDGAFSRSDIVRIDHFRGLESFWAVPHGAATAKDGRWVKGPGMGLVGALKGWFPDGAFIAEDLGYLTPEVRALLADSGFPGMKVLEFAFDSREPSDYLPHKYGTNCVCYTGTHDNDTLLGWESAAPTADVAFARQYLGLAAGEDLDTAILHAGMESAADIFIAQMQDYLRLGTAGRINVPGTALGNWVWRMRPGALTEDLARGIRAMTEAAKRL